MTVITKDQGKKTVFKYKMYTICPVYPRVQNNQHFTANKQGIHVTVNKQNSNSLVKIHPSMVYTDK